MISENNIKILSGCCAGIDLCVQAFENFVTQVTLKFGPTGKSIPAQHPLEILILFSEFTFDTY
jgi:hypothetical protein